MNEDIKSYNFKDTELKKLAILFRKNCDLIPDDLESFHIFLDQYIYNIMTIDEAEKFFHEN